MNQENSFIRNQTTFDINGYEITTNISSAIDASSRFQFTDSFTFDNLSIQENEEILKNKDLSITVDYSNPRNFVKYSSFSELIRYSIENIILNYPSTLHIKTNLIGYDYGDKNITDIQYSPLLNTTSFSISTNYIDNPFQLDYTNKNLNNKQFSSLFQNYVFTYNDIDFAISAFTPSDSLRNSKINITVSGKPFSDSFTQRVDAYIRPKDEYKKLTFERNFNGFQKYLLKDSFRFKAFKEADSGDSFVYNLKFSIPKYGDYNLDFFTNKYERFLSSLLEFTNEYDQRYSNISSRILIADSVQDITLTSNGLPTLGKPNVLINTISSFADQVYAQINAFKTYDYIYYDTPNVSQNRLNTLIKNQGLDVNKNINILSEDLKYLLINLPDLLNKKGTRDAIDFLFNYLNIPLDLVEFNEHVYKTKRINYAALEFLYSKISPDLILSSIPVKTDGSPDLSKIITHFQGSTYFDELQNLLPSVANNFLINTGTTTDAEILYQNDFNISGETSFNAELLNIKSLTGTPCYSFSGEIITHPLPETFLDECGCEIEELNDLAYKLCVSPLNIYDGACPSFVIDVVPDCISSPSSGETVSGQTQCVYNYSLISKNNNSNKVSPSVITNGVELSYDLVLTSDCEAGSIASSSIVTRFSQCYENNFIIQTSGYVDTIRLYDSINNNPVDLDLNPTTTSYFNGCSGVVNPDNLYFPSGDTSTYQASLQALIENGICDEFSSLPSIPTNGGQYNMEVQVNSGGTVSICFDVKDNPVNPIYSIGINKNDALFSYFDSATNYTTDKVISKLSSDDILETQNIACLSGNPLQINRSIDGATLLSNVSINYNDIILNNSSDIDTFELSSNTTGVCLIDGVFSGQTFDYGANLNINVYGGNPPYEFIGIQDGQYLASGQTYSVFAIDASGCTSNVVSGEVICNIDTCLGTKIEEKTRTITTTEIISNETLCDPIEYTLTYTYFRLDSERLTFQYNINFADIDFADISDFNILFRAVVQNGGPSFSFPININSTNYSETFMLNYDTLTFGTNIDYQNTIFLTYGEYDCRYSGSVSQIGDILVAPQQIIQNGTLALTPENVEIETTTTETYFEVVPNKPVVIASYDCIKDVNGDNTGEAQLSIQVSGGTPAYEYYGGIDGEVVQDGQTLDVFVIDSLNCKSNTVRLNIDCPFNEIECNPITLNAALETTSVDIPTNTATLTVSYQVLGLDINQQIQSVQLVSTGINGAQNYLIGSPVVSNFSTDVGAEQLSFDFDPFNNQNVDVKFFITITTDEGCVYTDIFELGVDASQLSSTDNYTKELS